MRTSLTIDAVEAPHASGSLLHFPFHHQIPWKVTQLMHSRKRRGKKRGGGRRNSILVRSLCSSPSWENEKGKKQCNFFLCFYIFELPRYLVTKEADKSLQEIYKGRNLCVPFIGSCSRLEVLPMTCLVPILRAQGHIIGKSRHHLWPLDII